MTDDPDDTRPDTEESEQAEQDRAERTAILVKRVAAADGSAEAFPFLEALITDLKQLEMLSRTCAALADRVDWDLDMMFRAALMDSRPQGPSLDDLDPEVEAEFTDDSLDDSPNDAQVMNLPDEDDDE